jgi:DNA polymerase-3 subunit beta
VDKLNILARGVSTRSALPVLSGVLLQAVDDRVDLFSTDMELSIKASLTSKATIEREGDVVVPARLFSDVVRNLSAEQIVIDASESAVKVAGGRAEFSLNAWSAGDFPQTSTFDMSDAFVVGREPFTGTLAKVGRAASRDETRPILTGVLVSIAGDTLKMVATDSYRLAVKETKLGEGDLQVVLSENQVIFHLPDPTGDIWLASRLIDGQFPNYKQLLPETFDHRVALDRDEFAAAARRVSLLAQKNAPLRLTFGPGRLQLRALTQDVGQAEEALDVAFDGEEDFEIGFNPAYLVDGIDAFDDDEVQLSFTSPLRPGLVTGGDGTFVYLIMPIRLSG